MSTILYAHKWISLLENGRGQGFIKMDDAAMAVPLLPDGNVIFIREYSVAYDQQIVYLPSGAVKPGELPDAALNRELQEEIGYKAGRIEPLGVLKPGIKYARWRFNIYLARDLTPSRLDGDESWTIEPLPIPLDEFERAIADGTLQDATVIAALYLARRFLQAG